MRKNEWSALAHRSVIASAVKALDNLARTRFLSYSKSQVLVSSSSEGSIKVAKKFLFFSKSKNSPILLWQRCKHRIEQVASIIQ